MIALLVNPDNVRVEGYIDTTREAARTKGVQLPVLKARTEGELEIAFASLGQLQAGGLLLLPDPFPQQPVRATRGTRITLCHTGDLRGATVRGGRRPDELWN